LLAHGRLGIAYLVVFVSSACTLVLEIVAGRVLAPYVGVSLYTWTSIIGVVLAGITVGNYAGGVLADRRPCRSTLGALLLAGGVASLTVLVLAAVVAPAPVGQLPLMLRILLLATAIFFVPSAILGMISPVVVRLSLDDLSRAGHTVGKIYACSALGSIVGTFATGFFLIAWFGTRAIILGVGVVLVVLAVACGDLWRPAWRPAAIGVLLALAMFGLSASGLLAGPCNVAESSYYCIQYRDGEYGGHPVRQLILDHLIHSHSDLHDPTYLAYDYERVYAAVTADVAARRQARGDGPPRALLIGGGGYTYPRYLAATYPGAVVEVAEIDPAVTQAAYTHMGVAPDAAVVSYNRDARIVVDDLLAAGRQYDLIFGDAFNDLSIPYHLTTREFAAKLSRLLAPGGVYVALVIDNPTEGEFMRAYARTLETVFPRIAVLTGQTSAELRGLATYVVAASAEPLDAARLDNPGNRVRVVSDARVAEWLAAGRSLVLTDDYVPVDNLMAPMFAERGD
jgi:spermidine synthase